MPPSKQAQIKWFRNSHKAPEPKSLNLFSLKTELIPANFLRFSQFPKLKRTAVQLCVSDPRSTRIYVAFERYCLLAFELFFSAGDQEKFL